MFVTRKWAPAVGGMETYSHRLTEELARNLDIEVVNLPGNQDGSPPSILRLLLFPSKVLRRWMSLTTPPNILHLGDMAIWPLGLLVFLSKGKTRLILSAHGTDVAYHRRGGAKGWLYETYLRLGSLLLANPIVIANSHATRAVLAETGWIRTRVVPLATDLVIAGTGGNHANHILFAGRLVERKGCGWFIRNVLPLLPETISLHVAGTIWDDEERSALDHPRVRYLGALEQKELANGYRSALCVIVPNIPVPTGEYEGFGLVAPEVASAGGVLLASRCDGLIDAVIDGETGFLIEPGNARAWAEAIVAILEWDDQARKSFIDHAQSVAGEHFSWSRVAEATVAIYQNGNDDRRQGDAPPRHM